MGFAPELAAAALAQAGNVDGAVDLLLSGNVAAEAPKEEESDDVSVDGEEQHDADVEEKAGEQPKPKLTPEEAEQRAVELQARLRQARVERERAEEIEREKNRLKSTKLLLEQSRLMEESEKKRQLEQREREKKVGLAVIYDAAPRGREVEAAGIASRRVPRALWRRDA